MKKPKIVIWKRCGGCGRLVKIPPNPFGRCCPKCGEALSKAREA